MSYLRQTQVLIVVNHMIFLKGLAFNGSQSGPQGRTLLTTGMLVVKKTAD